MAPNRLRHLMNVLTTPAADREPTSSFHETPSSAHSLAHIGLTL